MVQVGEECSESLPLRTRSGLKPGPKRSEVWQPSCSLKVLAMPFSMKLLSLVTTALLLAEVSPAQTFTLLTLSRAGPMGPVPEPVWP